MVVVVAVAGRVLVVVQLIESSLVLLVIITGHVSVKHKSSSVYRWLVVQRIRRVLVRDNRATLIDLFTFLANLRVCQVKEVRGEALDVRIHFWLGENTTQVTTVVTCQFWRAYYSQ